MTHLDTRDSECRLVGRRTVDVITPHHIVTKNSAPNASGFIFLLKDIPLSESGDTHKPVIFLVSQTISDAQQQLCRQAAEKTSLSFVY